MRVVYNIQARSLSVSEHEDGGRSLTVSHGKTKRCQSSGCTREFMICPLY